MAVFCISEERLRFFSGEGFHVPDCFQSAGGRADRWHRWAWFVNRRRSCSAVVLSVVRRGDGAAFRAAGALRERRRCGGNRCRRPASVPARGRSRPRRRS